MRAGPAGNMRAPSRYVPTSVSPKASHHRIEAYRAFANRVDPSQLAEGVPCVPGVRLHHPCSLELGPVLQIRP